MTHSFLVETGRWLIQGNWLERDRLPIPVKGMAMITWSAGNWFTIVTKLAFPEGDRDEIFSEYRGRLPNESRHYSYVLKQSLLGRIEGEGWIAPQSIVQRYWVLGDRQRRSGFETFYRLNPDTYHFSSGIFTGYYLTSTMEALLKRQI